VGQAGVLSASSPTESRRRRWTNTVCNATITHWPARNRHPPAMPGASGLDRIDLPAPAAIFAKATGRPPPAPNPPKARNQGRARASGSMPGLAFWKSASLDDMSNRRAPAARRTATLIAPTTIPAMVPDRPRPADQTGSWGTKNKTRRRSRRRAPQDNVGRRDILAAPRVRQGAGWGKRPVRRTFFYPIAQSQFAKRCFSVWAANKTLTLFTIPFNAAC